MFRTIPLVLVALFAALVVGKPGLAAPAANAARVAVFYEPDFPPFEVSPQMSPRDVVKHLRENKIDAELIGEAALSDPARFNAQKFAALILPYGNAYPAKAFAALREFHRAGGSFVLSGVPFTHPVERTADGKWKDLGHRGEPALFGADGIGVGGFAGPGVDEVPTVAANDLLGLAALNLDWTSKGRSQRLDPKTLPSTDVVTPIVGASANPAVALIEHRAAPFAGAIDVWTHVGPEGDLNAWATEQLLLRGTVLILERKGLLTAAQRDSAYTRFARLSKPRVFADVVLPTAPRNSPYFQPKMPTPARRLYVADIRKLTFDERVLLISLQGLVNRVQPQIYLIVRNDDRFWLDEMKRQGHTDEAIPVDDPLGLVERFRSFAKGAVVADPKVYVSPCVAACVSGADDLLMATPELAARLNLLIKTDLRGKFKDNADALRFIRTQLQPRLNPYLTCCLDPTIFDSGALDQLIAARGTVFWITGTAAQNLPGATGNKERDEVMKWFAALPLGATVRGFWWHGEDKGINEGPGVSLASRFGKVTVVTDYVANFSVFSGIPQTELKQKPPPPPPKLDPSKIYFSFTMSDGDNLCTWRDYFRTYFNDPLHGTIPIGWGMGPTLIDSAPVWARWYYDHATPNDEFLCDVSGIGYIYGPDWGRSLKDREGAFADFYQWTAQYMKRMDMHTIRLMNVNPPDIARAARLLPDVRFLMPDYGNPGDKPYSALTYDLPNDQTVFRAITGADGGAEKLAQQIRERVGSTRPAFVNVFIWNWGSKLADLKRVMELLGSDYVAVTPSQLHALYKQNKTLR